MSSTHLGSNENQPAFLKNFFVRQLLEVRKDKKIPVLTAKKVVYDIYKDGPFRLKRTVRKPKITSR
jgi:hypothetical protein